MVMNAIGDKKGFVRFSDTLTDDQNKVVEERSFRGSILSTKALSVYMNILDALLSGIKIEKRFIIQDAYHNWDWKYSYNFVLTAIS
jgi:hypothetical protein